MKLSHAWLGLALSLFSCRSLVAQQQPLSTHAHQAVEIIRQLRTIGLPKFEDEDDCIAPPARVPGLLRQLNQELRDLIVEDLNDPHRRGVPSEQNIFDQLAAAGWEEIPSDKWNAYGEIRQIGFDLQTGYEPGVLIVSTQLWLPNGNADPDSAIYVFQGAAREWRLALFAESDFDPTADSDQTGFQYKIAPPDSQGHWFLVVAHLPPSCVSESHILRYEALRPGATVEKPIILQAGKEEVNPFFMPPFRIDVATDWFAVTEGKERKLDGELGIAISRYDLSGSEARRINPLALSPEDFLDRWIQLSWEEASRFTSSAPGSDLQEWHSKLGDLVAGSTEIESVQPCTERNESSETWLIGLSIGATPNPSMKQDHLYVEIEKVNGVFTLDRIDKADPGGCPGRTRPSLILDHELPNW